MHRELFLERLIMLEVDCRCHGLADYPTEICHKLLSSSFCTTNSANTTGSAGSYGTNGIPVWTCSMVYSCSEPKSKLIAWGATCNRGLIGISWCGMCRLQNLNSPIRCALFVSGDSRCSNLTFTWDPYKLPWSGVSLNSFRIYFSPSGAHVSYCDFSHLLLAQPSQHDATNLMNQCNYIQEAHIV